MQCMLSNLVTVWQLPQKIKFNIYKCPSHSIIPNKDFETNIRPPQKHTIFNLISTLKHCNSRKGVTVLK